MPKPGYREAARLYPLAGVVCERCATRPARERHHRDGRPTNNARANVELVCVSCHQINHKRKERCPAGHLLAGDNLYLKGNHAVCRECARAAARRWYARNREAQRERNRVKNARYRSGQ